MCVKWRQRRKAGATGPLATLDIRKQAYAGCLPPSFPPIRGAEHLAKYWRKFKNLLDLVWRLDHIMGRGDEVVSEWSCLWTPQGTTLRVMMRGTEWYVMREGRIAEVRAYFLYNDSAHTQLTGFPYAGRDYLSTSD